MLHGRTIFLAVFSTCAAAASGAVAQPVDFVRDVQPILREHCYKCHGSKRAEGGVRWDRKAMAFAAADSGRPPIIAGDAHGSHFIELITADNPEQRMPREGDPLPPEQIDILTRWVVQGAPWPDGVDPADELTHWSFIAPQRPKLPAVSDESWPRNGIDRFVMAQLDRHGLAPSPSADAHMLARRVYLDIIGLPPSPQQLREFVSDPRPDAYERLVDRLLNDPAYGERWAKMWLDLARYADSSGYGSDQLRPHIWPYRDYVISAFNHNYSYERFTIEQLAGDLLIKSHVEGQKSQVDGSATSDHRPVTFTSPLIATAFHRNTMTNVEGGTDDEEFRVAAVKDRVDTTVQAWMGLTMGCAQCHTHKYDPITQREYYQFYAIFNQTEDRDLPDEFPTLLLRSEELDAAAERIKGRIDHTRSQIEALAPQLAAAEIEWEQSLPRPIPSWRVLRPSTFTTAGGSQLAALDDGSLLASGELPMFDTYTLTFETDLRGITALRLEALPDDTLPGRGPGRSGSGNFVLNELTLLVGETPVKFAKATADFAQSGFEPAKAIDGKTDGAGWAIAPRFGRRHEAIFVLSEPLAATDSDRPIPLTVVLNQNYLYHSLGRLRLSATFASDVDSMAPPEIAAILDVARPQRTAEQAAKVAEYYRTIAPLTAELRQRLSKLETQLAENRGQGTPVPIMRELAADKQRTSRMMIKGNFLTPGDEVSPALPAAFGRALAEKPVTRWTVAKWLLDPSNPLTSRVAVNRFWSQLFGVGLVETEEDFGTQGAEPSHPQLLDFLATQFMASGWDMKAMVRLIVTSATYRQASHVTPGLYEKDPSNRLLARGPRFRLSAEAVRDQALATAGLLTRKIGGPSVFPPQPDGLWAVAFNAQRNWDTSTDEDRFRRGVYTFWRRTVPYPSMAAFDATSREICTPRRMRTNTPLQVFVTLNDPVYVEAAQALARRIIGEGGPTPESRARYALELCTARPAAPEQQAQIVALFETERKHYEADPSAAAQLIKPLAPGIDPVPQDISPAELAAWTIVANLLLNLDAVLMKG